IRGPPDHVFGGFALPNLILIDNQLLSPSTPEYVQQAALLHEGGESLGYGHKYLRGAGKKERDGKAPHGYNHGFVARVLGDTAQDGLTDWLVRKKDFIPKIAPEYAQDFVQEFITMLDGIDLSQSPERCRKEIMEGFDKLRQKQEDLWLQPYLMLDDESAILIFKNGPNAIRFGTSVIAYKIPLTSERVAELKALLDTEGALALLRELYIPHEAYLDRFETEERIAIAARSMDHSTHLNYPGLLHFLQTELGYLLWALREIPVDTTNEDARNLLTAAKKSVDFCSEICHNLMSIVKYHKGTKVLCLKESGIKKREELIEALEESLRRLLVLQTEWNNNYAAIEGFKVNYKDRIEDIEIVELVNKWIHDAIAILQAERDFIMAESNDSIETRNGVELLEATIPVGAKSEMSTISVEPIEITEPKFSLPMIHRKTGKHWTLDAEIEDLESLREYSLSGNWRALAFSIENAIYGAANASIAAYMKKIAEGADENDLVKPKVEIKVNVVTLEDGHDYIKVVIRDYGNGIPEEHRFKISDPDFSTKARETGWAFARRAIHDAGGKVEIDSRTADDEEYSEARAQAGVGTDVIIHWPVNPPKKILLVYLVDENNPSLDFPVGLYALKSYLERQYGERCTVEIKDVQLEDMESIVAYAIESKPDMIGLSLMIGADKRFEEFMSSFASRAPPEYKPLLVAGKNIPTFVPAELLKKYPELICVRGEGELAIGGLLEYMEGKNELSSVNNIVYLEDGSPVDTQRKLLPSRDLVGKVDYSYAREYISRGGNVWMETARGCPWGECAYCSGNIYWGMVIWRHRPVGVIVEELRQLEELGVKRIMLTDEEFFGGNMGGIERARKLALAIIESGVNISFYTNARVDAICNSKDTPQERERRLETLKLLKRAGLQTIFLGIETGSPSQMWRYQKGLAPINGVKGNEEAIRMCEEAVRICKEIGFEMAIGWIMLEPLVTKEELLECINFIKRNEILKYLSTPLNQMIMYKSTSYYNLVRKEEKRLGRPLLSDECDIRTLAYEVVDFKNLDVKIIAGVLKEYVDSERDLYNSLKWFIRFNPHANEEEFKYIREYLELFKRCQIDLAEALVNLKEEEILESAKPQELSRRAIEERNKLAMNLRRAIEDNGHAAACKRIKDQLDAYLGAIAEPESKTMAAEETKKDAITPQTPEGFEESLRGVADDGFMAMMLQSVTRNIGRNGKERINGVERVDNEEEVKHILLPRDKRVFQIFHRLQNGGINGYTNYVERYFRIMHNIEIKIHFYGSEEELPAVISDFNSNQRNTVVYAVNALGNKAKQSLGLLDNDFGKHTARVINILLHDGEELAVPILTAALKALLVLEIHHKKELRNGRFNHIIFRLIELEKKIHSVNELPEGHILKTLEENPEEADIIFREGLNSRWPPVELLLEGGRLDRVIRGEQRLYEAL
ncbi:MAG: radical SAM protein, partial [Candidatus Omnitrophica bacterium]|nr:radical SAM protein [Candidatus Omnitrophota bacterium]